MKVVFVDPRGWQGAAEGQRAYPNVGIAYLSAALKAKGHQVTVVDLNNHSMTDQEAVAKIKEAKPGLIGFSVKTATMSSARSIANLLKSEGVTTPLLIGGPHTALAPVELIGDLAFDGVAVGEGEHLMIEILRVLECGGSLDDVDGLGTRNRLSQGFLPSKNLVGSLEDLVYPDYDVFSPTVRASLEENYPLVTTRGCVYKCTFCSVPEISGKRFRRSTPQYVIEELNIVMQKYRVRGFEVIDDIFNLDVTRCKDICLRIIEANLNLRFTCANGIRADRIDAELATLLKMAGCYHVCVGVESGDDAVFSRVNKGESLSDVRRGIVFLREAGIDVTGFFIIGLPGDSVPATEKSIHFAKETGITAFFNMLVPYQGTQIYDWAIERGRLLGNPEVGRHFNDDPRQLSIVFETDDFPAKEKRRAWEMAHLKLHQWHRLFPSDISPIFKMIRLLKLAWEYDRGRIPEYVLASLQTFFYTRTERLVRYLTDHMPAIIPKKPD